MARSHDDTRNARSWRVPNDKTSPEEFLNEMGLVPLQEDDDDDSASLSPFSSNQSSDVEEQKSPRYASSPKSVPHRHHHHFSSPQNNTAYGNYEEDEDADDGIAFRTKVWYYLFRNLNQVVEELYCMCELESSREQSTIASRVLGQFHSDFEALTERLTMQSTMPAENPRAALAWEVRKRPSNCAEIPTVVEALRHRKASGSSSSDIGSFSHNSITESEMYSQYGNQATHDLETLRINVEDDDEDEDDDDLWENSPTHHHHNNNSNSSSRRSLHEKLSSPERRKRSPSETKRLHEQRFNVAQDNRIKLDVARQTRFRIAKERLKDVSDRNAQKLARQEEEMWAKLGRADALHEAHLNWITRKAGSENTKVDEVGFIKSLTNEHRKASLQDRLDGVATRREQRLRQIRTRASENAENVRIAAERRERTISNDIAEKHAAMLKRHEDVEARRLELQEEFRQRVVDAASKEHKVSVRRKVIAKKRRKKAAHGRYGAGNDIVTASSTSHNSAAVSDNPEQTMLQKAAKLRSVLSATSPGYIERMDHHHLSSDTKRRYFKILGRLDPELTNSSTTLATHLDTVYTALKDLIRLHEGDEGDLDALRHLGGLHRVAKWASRATASVSPRVAAKALEALASSCTLPANRDYILATNCLPELVDLLVWILLSSSDNTTTALSQMNADLLANALDAVTLPLQHVTSEDEIEDVRRNLIPYIVNTGAIVLLSDRFEQFRSSFTSGADTVLLLKCVGFLEALTAKAGFSQMSKPVLTMSDLRLPIMNVFIDTGLMGIVPLLVSLLMESRPQRRSESMVLPPKIQDVSTMALRVLNNVAKLDICIVQKTLSSQQEFIHMLGYFLESTVASNQPSELLNEVLILVGYYALRNSHHQDKLRWGNPVNLLQRLTNLPVTYYIDENLKDVLFPTLISVCYGNTRNKAIMEGDLNSLVLVTYIRKKWEEQCTSLRQEVGHESPPWMRFAGRFPVFLWKDAINFFSNLSVYNNFTK